MKSRHHRSLGAALRGRKRKRLLNLLSYRILKTRARRYIAIFLWKGNAVFEKVRFGQMAYISHSFLTASKR